MYKTFLFGIVLGLALTAGVAWFVPAADLTREASIISVQPNGGNAETFQVRIPDDRIIAGSNDPAVRLPAVLQWPEGGSGVDVEVFKVRNQNDIVIGVASRMSASGAAGTVEWAIHLPARGTLYFPMSGITSNGGRQGTLRAGTGEFLKRQGQLREVFVAAPDNAGNGRIELKTSLVSTVSESAAGYGEGA